MHRATKLLRNEGRKLWRISTTKYQPTSSRRTWLGLQCRTSSYPFCRWPPATWWSAWPFGRILAATDCRLSGKRSIIWLYFLKWPLRFCSRSFHDFPGETRRSAKDAPSPPGVAREAALASDKEDPARPGFCPNRVADRRDPETEHYTTSKVPASITIKDSRNVPSWH